MASISDRVAIIGMGCTTFGEKWEDDPESMIVDAASEAFADAGIEGPDVQAAWVGTVLSGMTGQALTRPLKLDMLPVTRVENACATGADAIRNAAFAVAAGVYDVVLCVGFEKLKDSGLRGLPGGEAGHPVLTNGVTAPGGFAMAATRYMGRYGATKETLAKIAVKNHANGAKNPKAHLRKEITVDQVVNAPMISAPLGLLDCCPTTDGAAAAVLCRADLAPQLTRDYALIKGLGLAVGKGAGSITTDFDYTSFPETTAAARQAYEQAGITDPLDQIDVAEVHDCFTITELLIYEDLGLVGRGEGKDAVDDGTFEPDGSLPVNIDGGLKSFGHPVGASGIRMIYELYLQLLGRADARQLRRPELGLAHSLGGMPGAFACAVTLLGTS